MPAKPGNLRIVGGLWRGRTIRAGDNARIRPTSERTREALFDILAHAAPFRTEHGPMPRGITVLDVFAGTGALGLEALSRGAKHAVMLDNDAGAATLIRGNIAKLEADDRASVLQRDALNPGIGAHKALLVLLDPPYGSNLAAPALAALDAAGWIAPGATAVAELAVNEDLVPPNGFAVLDTRRYGKAKLIFLRREA
ncbi:MAG TPA: 16S rRNA (guanine(966)-N(2))-methyltransferase RsmD [Candidatus Cybelea sp.]|nr:16S rRNA (guanine(966)-N(2))-methyltransferase RsmD [Candidatus Cybelea sp.]